MPNKATADVMALAQVYTKEALATLAKIMREGDSDAARVASVKELLNRGHGMSRQIVDTTITDERMVVEAPQQAKDADEWAGKYGAH